MALGAVSPSRTTPWIFFRRNEFEDDVHKAQENGELEYDIEIFGPQQYEAKEEQLDPYTI
ncbi:MAG: hypothetical protein ABEJ07_05660 [Candidatus Nanohaloarchaea archaeon]